MYARLILLAISTSSGLAFAQAGDPVTAPSSASIIALQLLSQLLPYLVTIIGLVLTGLVVMPLKRWLVVKAETSTLAKVGLKVEGLTESIVADLNATMVKEVQAAMADGVITKEEATRLRTVALERLKAQLGTKGLAELGGVLGIGGQLLEQYLGGLIEKKVEEAKALGAAAEATVTDGQAAVDVINKG